MVGERRHPETRTAFFFFFKKEKQIPSHAQFRERRTLQSSELLFIQEIFIKKKLKKKKYLLGTICAMHFAKLHGEGN